MDKIKASQFADLAYYSKQRPLPPYIEVDYLEGTGSQYIDTGIVPSTTDWVEVVFQLTTTTTTDNTIFYIDSGSSNTNAYGFSVAYYPGTHVGYVCGWQTMKVAGNLDTNQHTMKMGNFEFHLDNSLLTSFFVYAPTVTQSIRLWGWLRNGNILLCGKVKIFRFTVTTSSNVKRIDLVPRIRRSDSKPGMYDLVSKTFFTNAGTGEFSVGGTV